MVGIVGLGNQMMERKMNNKFNQEHLWLLILQEGRMKCEEKGGCPLADSTIYPGCWRDMVEGECFLIPTNFKVIKAIIAGAKCKVDRTYLSKDNTTRKTIYDVEVVTPTTCSTCGDDKRVGYWSTMHDQWLDRGPCPDCIPKGGSYV